MAASKSKSSEYSFANEERKMPTKGRGKEISLPALDNCHIIATRVAKAFKRWKKLQIDIPRKQEKVNNGHRSKFLESNKRERDVLVEQMQQDIPELQSIFDDEYSQPFDRKDKIRTTTGGMLKKKTVPENRETHSLRPAEAEINKLTRQLEEERKSKEEALQSSKSAEAEITKLTRQLQDERRSKEESLRQAEEYRNEKSTLEQRYQEKIKNLEEDIRMLKERTKEQEQLQRQAASIGQKENDDLKEECKRLNRKLDESENEKVALKLRHKEEIGAHKEEIRKVKERHTVDKSSYEKREKELNTKCDELKADIASYMENWKTSEDAKIQLEIKITELEKKSKEGEREIKKWNNQYNSLEEEKRRTIEEFKRLEAKNNQLTNQLENERKAKEDALLRLSSMASNKLRDNNPNIADLSDPNRPTKLSEQFSELYDNEWTDAFDELEKLLSDKKEKEIISYLRDFVLEIHSVCSDISSSKMKTIEEAFVKPSVPSENTKIPTEIFKTIKDGIKSMAPKLLEHTRERVLGHLEEKYFRDPVAGCLQHQNVKRYIDKCTEVCWYMSVQDPQLVMDGSKSPDEKFDSNKHREYTKKGPYEEFVVWPALYLYRGGQMLSKGVAQGGKKEIGQQ